MCCYGRAPEDEVKYMYEVRFFKTSTQRYVLIYGQSQWNVHVQVFDGDSFSDMTVLLLRYN